MMINDRKIIISTGASRQAKVWTPQTLLISELYEKLKTPARGRETLEQYLSLSKAKQDELKDVGGYVGGEIVGGRRKASSVAGRDILTLDLDHIPAGGTVTVLQRVEALGCGYCVYSTRKHSPAAPRLRVLFPLDRTATADEYGPIARKLAEMIGIEMADPSTFEPSRLMYWPSCCADSEYIYQPADKPCLSADGVLAMYTDWHNVALWPQVPGAEKTPKRLATKQGDPEGKKGVVGAFCRTYDILKAMDTFLPGVYETVDGFDDRYTYTGGSTAGGAILYDGGKFLFSHHATDPCSGRLVNSFDLVRLHKFGDLDDTAEPGTPTNRLPSYAAMSQLAVEDKTVSGLLLKERWEEAADSFTVTGAAITENISVSEDESWRQKLSVSAKTGMPQSTIDNIWIILEHDPILKGKFALNEFAGRGEVLGPVPWSKKAECRAWQDSDNDGLYWYMEKYYGITGVKKIDGALTLHSEKHSFNNVRDYLTNLQWDGTPRLDSIFIDYLGAEDTPYTRTVTRKAFTAAAARALVPGIKFDCMTILSGPQGIGKSTLLDHMSKGWFNDSIRSFEGKDASELLQGVWLVEISELDAFRRTDVARIKQFLSLRADRFRAAYGRNVKEMPRCCVFFGTTNSEDYLQDKTGNRRFWPIDVGKQPRNKNVWRDLDEELDQLWAEAVAYFRLGESLFLSGDIEAEAKTQQEGHREVSAREGLIIDFIEKPVPVDWCRWDLNRRRIYWNGGVQEESLETIPRDRVCALEVWCELLEGQKKDMKYSDTQEINAILTTAPGWKRTAQALKFGYCGAQRGFVRGNIQG